MRYEDDESVKNKKVSRKKYLFLLIKECSLITAYYNGTYEFTELKNIIV